MQRSKRDWKSLYFEYLTSDQEEVFAFLKQKGVASKESKGISGAMAEQSKGWYVKKQAFKDRVMDIAIKKLEKTTAEKIYKPSLKELGEMHQRAIAVTKIALNGLTIEKIGKDGKKIWVIDPSAVKISKEIKDLWEIIKVEKKEPTKYIEDLTPPQAVELTDKQKTILERFRKKKK